MSQDFQRPAPKFLAYAIGFDLLLTIIFAVSGRSSHQEYLSIGGVFSTAWPFLSALAIGWLLTRNWRHPVRLAPNGLCIWLITVAGGMTLRILSGGTAAFAFVVVATLVLGLFLLGHRYLATLVSRRIKKS